MQSKERIKKMKLYEYEQLVREYMKAAEAASTVRELADIGVNSIRFTTSDGVYHTCYKCVDDTYVDNDDDASDAILDLKIKSFEWDTDADGYAIALVEVE